jgi:N-acetylmuramoyl-L-alanine amidase
MALAQEKRKQRNMRIRTFAVVTGTLLAGGAVIALLVFFVMGGSGAGYKVPDVIGKTYEQARNKVESSGLSIEIDPFQDSSAAADLDGLKVQEQDPGAGSPADKGEMVTVRLNGLRDSALRTDSSGKQRPDGGSVPASGTTGAQPAQDQLVQAAQPASPSQEQPSQSPAAAAPQPAPASSTGQARTVCLDPGHSADSPVSEIDPASGLDVADNGGADGEIQAMWELALKTKTHLEHAGYRVVLTKDSAESYASLRRRADIGNTCSIVIRLHYDPALHALLFPGEGQYKEHGGNRVTVDPGVAAASRILAGSLFPSLKNVGVTRLMNDAGGTSNNSGPAYVGSVLSRVPVVLIENDPSMVAGNPAGQEEVASAITQGVGAYFEGR